MVCEATIQVQQPEQQQLKAAAAVIENVAPSSSRPISHFNWDQRARAKACMQTLVMALADDPVNNYFSGSKRVKFCKDEVKGYLKALPDAANFIATDDSMAVALWQLLPQETPRNELWAGWTRILQVAPRLWRQLLKLELHYEAAHEDASAQFGSYYYLSFIGSRPEARGRGYGSLLLSYITQRADAEGRWCVLEATSEKSQALYARHGFVTHETYRVSKKAPPVFLMKRAPTIPPPPAAAAAISSTPLSAAALQLAAAVHGKAGLAAAVASPGSECGHSSCSSLISAVMRGHEVESDSDRESVSDIAEESEGDEDDEAEAEQKCDLKMLPADAGVIIRSNSSVLNLKENASAAALEGAAAAADVTATAAGLSLGSSGSSRNGRGSKAGDSNQEPKESSSSSSSNSSSSAGAGGPTNAAAGSA